MDEVIFDRRPLRRQPARAAVYVWSVTASLALLILFLIIGAPLAQAGGHPQVASFIYKTFSFVCHQIPERSFHLGGYKFAACSRCTGLYSGFALAALAYPLVRPLDQTVTPSRVWLILAALPIAIDFSLGYFNIWQNTHLSRFTTGALLSSVAVFYIIPGVVELTTKLAKRSAKESVQ